MKGRHAVLVPLMLCAAPALAQTSDADEAVAAARKAAGQDRHDEAIDGFRRAIRTAPGRSDEWLVELADQLTWSGRLDEAIATYREAAKSADADRLRRARIGLGRALSRDDRQGEALAVYRDVLRDHPEDPEALRGLGRVLSWRGRHRDATAEMRQLLADRPHDREAVAILAESFSWMGRPDKAERALREQLAADPDDSRAASLLRDVTWRQRPEARIDWRESDQSDDLRVTEVAATLQFTMADGRLYAGPRYTHAVLRPGHGPVERITLRRPGIMAGYRASDALEVRAAAALDIIDTKGATGDHILPTFEVYATYRPNDILRFDAGASRWTFDSEETLREGLAATQLGVSADLLPDERTVLSGRYSRTDYSDGNERRWWQVQANRRLLNRPRVVAGYRYTGFTFKTPWQGGYYNPDRYRTHEFVLYGSGQLARRLRWDFRFIGGYETEIPGRSRGTVSGGASLAREIAPYTEIEIAFDHSSSRAFATGGFARSVGRLTLRARF